jgi:hypothetical protein
MLQTLSHLFSFIRLVFVHGSINPPPPPFSSWRLRELNGLEHYLPSDARLASKTSGSGTVRAFAALVKEGLMHEGGHLSLPSAYLYYVRVPRAASTALSNLILKAQFPNLPPLTPVQVNFLTDMWIDRNIHSSLASLTGFSCVRHPLHRLVSVYRQFFENPDQEYFIYHGYLMNVLTPDLDFGEFVRRIRSIPVRLLDPHLRPQYTFFQPYWKRNLRLNIFKLEQPHVLTGFLRNYELDMIALNTSPQPYDYRAYYTTRTLNWALYLYDSDMRVFGYGQ